ncbi:MAG TPA: phosphoadenosine phosphosulfate reductase family protein [Kiritimatiellia bacterium]|mgnify:CR=1 FL=1|nr:phosphoadenosine phosphosulfate reductase family protein [Kiritimatiellia bacterium]
MDLKERNHQLRTATAGERIRLIDGWYPGHAVLTTSFGMYSAVMLHLVKTHAPHLPILSVDIGFNAETLAFADTLVERLGLSIVRYAAPANATPDALKQAKVDLLEQALREHRAGVWMSGVLRSETEHRATFDFLIAREDGLVKAHPVLDWTTRDLFTYCKEHDLPINDAYFDPLKGDDQKQECGIHLTGMANVSYTSSEL